MVLRDLSNLFVNCCLAFANGTVEFLTGTFALLAFAATASLILFFI